MLVPLKLSEINKKIKKRWKSILYFKILLLKAYSELSNAWSSHSSSSYVHLLWFMGSSSPKLIFCPLSVHLVSSSPFSLFIFTCSLFTVCLLCGFYYLMFSFSTVHPPCCSSSPMNFHLHWVSFPMCFWFFLVFCFLGMNSM